MFQYELSSKLPPVTDCVLTGEAVVHKVFQLTGSKKATVAGCRVKQGTLTRKDTKYRVLRDGNVMHEGTERRLRYIVVQATRSTSISQFFIKKDTENDFRINTDAKS